jgi:hypothetical protein
MPEADPIFAVDLEPDEALALREQPAPEARVLAELAPGQLVARLDEDDRGGWWRVFADTPGDGAYVGYIQSRNVRPWSHQEGGMITPPAEVDEAPAPAPPPTAPTPAGAPSWPDPPGRAATPGWNPLIPERFRHESPNYRRPNAPRLVNRVVIHITGGASWDSCHPAYMRLVPADKPFDRRPKISPHYVIDKNGDVHQYVQESDVAYHAGIREVEQAMYERGDWRRYTARWKRFESYPPDTVFLAEDGATEVPRGSDAARYARSVDAAGWAEHALFDRRWGRQPLPIGYRSDKSGNARSIGIETVGYGSTEPGPSHYTEAMYVALARLVTDICTRYGLQQIKGVVVGHEDVNPITRGAWDPGQGFDWSRVWTADA